MKSKQEANGTQIKKIKILEDQKKKDKQFNDYFDTKFYFKDW